MATLRRRIVDTFRDSPSPSPSREGTPGPTEDVRLIPVQQLKALKHKGRKRRNGLIFGLGGLFGVFLAVFFAQQQDVIRFEGLMDVNLDSLVDVLPAGLIKDAKDLTVSVFFYSSYEIKR